MIILTVAIGLASAAIGCEKTAASSTKLKIIGYDSRRYFSPFLES